MAPGTASCGAQRVRRKIGAAGDAVADPQPVVQPDPLVRAGTRRLDDVHIALVGDHAAGCAGGGRSRRAFVVAVELHDEVALVVREEVGEGRPELVVADVGERIDDRGDGDDVVQATEIGGQRGPVGAHEQRVAVPRVEQSQPGDRTADEPRPAAGQLDRRSLVTERGGEGGRPVAGSAPFQSVVQVDLHRVQTNYGV